MLGSALRLVLQGFQTSVMAWQFAKLKMVGMMVESRTLEIATQCAKNILQLMIRFFLRGKLPFYPIHPEENTGL